MSDGTQVPSQRVGHPRQRLYTVLTGVLLASLVVGTPAYGQWLASGYVQRILIGIGISVILVVSLNLSNGFTGVFSLGHVGFMAIGAYTASILTLPLSLKEVNLPDLPRWLAGVEMGFLPATLIGGVLAVIVAFLVGLSLMRLSGPYVAMATMGFLVIMQVVLVNWDTMTRGARTFAGVPPYTTLWWVWGWAMLAVYAIWRLSRSGYGRRMKAVRDNEIAAQSLGISVMHSRLLAFCVSAFFTAVAGSLWAHFITAFSPKSFYFAQTFSVITMLVIGGMGSVSGSILGAVLITLVSEILRNAERGVNLGFVHVPPVYGGSQILIAVIFVLVIIFWPKGLMGDREVQFNRLWERLLPVRPSEEVG
ncbi:MAG: branched-chain amino acid ABC transporter permease [Chloroflexi bacterium]|nr:branched-chain amino acid ABC transporter permease [Chloroflexota bacterium]